MTIGLLIVMMACGVGAAVTFLSLMARGGLDTQIGVAMRDGTRAAVGFIVIALVFVFVYGGRF